MIKKRAFLASLASLLLMTPALGSANYGPACDFGGGKAAFLLLTLAAGYWVLTLAQKQAKPLNLIGRIIGLVILVASLGGLVCVAASRLWCRSEAACEPGSHGAMMMGKGCPFSGSPEAKEPQP